MLRTDPKSDENYIFSHHSMLPMMPSTSQRHAGNDCDDDAAAAADDDDDDHSRAD